MSTENRSCIITGAGTGIGKATARKLTQMGYKAALVGRTRSKLEETREEIGAGGGMAGVFPCDIRSWDAVHKMVEAVVAELGEIDALINNAALGSCGVTMRNMDPMTVEAIIHTNLVGPMYLAHAVLPGMLSRKQGTIVNVASYAVKNPGTMGGPAYCASKAGIQNFTYYLNNELKNTGVRACCVVPASTDTPMWESNPVLPTQAVRDTMLDPEDVADVIALAVTIHPRALLEEVFVKPTMSPDRSMERW